ncbi:MAG: glycosyltransferase [Terrisporobacter sp.]|uniref:glycosyltransferase n=1 Tax=Terrisporobacter sp. TaxID=1965305 RepID=UPI0039A17D11
MKKKILFLVSDMESGGFQKSLISLLQCFDYKKYDVDLLVLCPKGIFMGQIPKEVNLLSVDISSSFFSSFPKSSINLIKEKQYILAIKRCIHFIISRFNKGIGAIYMANQIPALINEYDVAIDYNGQQILYYMVNKIKAHKKISYFHSDYKKWPYYKLSDKKYYSKVDYIVTISDICKESLDEIFPKYKDKTKVIHNISSPEIINKLATEECSINFDDKYTNVIMVGRPSDIKGYDFAIEACSKLKKDGEKVKFYSIGTSNDVDKFKKLVTDLDVEKEFIFIGETDNPYKFVKKADIYVHPSRFEGKSVAIDEAKILCKPIVITNFTTAKDHINNEVNGLIVGMNSEEVYKGIKILIKNTSLQEKFENNLSKENLGNESEVYKLYDLIEQVKV